MVYELSEGLWTVFKISLNGNVCDLKIWTQNLISLNYVVFVWTYLLSSGVENGDGSTVWNWLKYFSNGEKCVRFYYKCVSVKTVLTYHVTLLCIKSNTFFSVNLYYIRTGDISPHTVRLAAGFLTV